MGRKTRGRNGGTDGISDVGIYFMITFLGEFSSVNWVLLIDSIVRGWWSRFEGPNFTELYVKFFKLFSVLLTYF